MNAPQLLASGETLSPSASVDTKIAVVLGTRPEIIKLGPVIALLGDRCRVIHTGQHYDEKLAHTFFEAFGIDVEPEVVSVGGKSRGAQIGATTSSLTAHFESSRPTAVIVQGDTNSTAGASLAANACELPLIHVEAGLRSHDRRMPEEHNRVIADHLSDLCLAPTEVSAKNLVTEGIPRSRIVVTGNTVVDAVTALTPGPAVRQSFLTRHSVEPGAFVLSTFHRPENVDDPDRLRSIIDELAGFDLPVLLPLHPRTVKQAEKNEIAVDKGSIRRLGPIGYVEFLSLLAECAIAVSDSGGVQEEVSVLKRPMVVVRNSTERPEVIGTFCRLVQPGPDIGLAAGEMLELHPFDSTDLRTIPSPYGDGDAAEKSVTAIDDLLGQTKLDD